MISLKPDTLHRAAAYRNRCRGIGTCLRLELGLDCRKHVDELYHAVEYLVYLRACGELAALNIRLSFAKRDLLVPLSARLELLVDGLEEKLAQNLNEMLGVFKLCILKAGLAQRLYGQRRGLCRDLGGYVAQPHAAVRTCGLGVEFPDRFVGIKVNLHAADVNVSVHILVLLFSTLPAASAATISKTVFL